MPGFDDYAPIVGDGTLMEIRALARALKGRSVAHVNTTAVGGGVAEILNRMVPLLNELGVKTRWPIMKGNDAFYGVTKKFHNALHGDTQDISAQEYEVYNETVEANVKDLDLGDDFVFIHDPQPCAMVKQRVRHKNRWLWRCHIDVSKPQKSVWEFLKPHVEKYDAMVISAPPFAQKVAIPQGLIAPSIDPLSDKNRDLSDAEINEVMTRLKIPRDKPLVTQVSRFDRLKDPLGVIQAFKMARRYVDARLVLIGGSADDDPEGAQVLAEVREAAGTDPDILVLSLPPTSHLEVNAVQRASAIVMQKSLKEGFALTVSEALWKGKAVIAGAVGGIPLQVLHERTGALVHTVEGAAAWITRFIKDPLLAQKMGMAGREHVRANFLLTRHLRDYLLLFLAADNPGADFIRIR